MTKPNDGDAYAPLLSGHGGHDEYGAVAAAIAVSDGSGSGDGSGCSPGPEVQEGVRRIEAVARTWSKGALVVAYMRFVDLDHHVRPCPGEYCR